MTKIYKRKEDFLKYHALNQVFPYTFMFDNLPPQKKDIFTVAIIRWAARTPPTRNMKDPDNIAKCDLNNYFS